MHTVVVETDSVSQTIQLGRQLGELLKGGETIECRSDLGGGKTTLASGFAQGIGSKDPVSSPSFTICNTYQGSNKQMFHFDFYRLQEPGIMANELSEVLDDATAVCFIEWADIVEELLPEKHLTIVIHTIDETCRRIECTIPDAYSYLMAALKETA